MFSVYFFYYQSWEFEFIFFIFCTLEINMYMLSKKCCWKKKILTLLAIKVERSMGVKIFHDYFR